MNRSTAWSRAILVSVAGLVTSGPACAAVAPLRAYHEFHQRLLTEVIVPRLAAAAGGMGARAPAGIEAVVTAGRDPLQVDVERRPDGVLQFTASAGFFVFLDALVDAEVLGRKEGRASTVLDYADEVVAYAGRAMRDDAGGMPPRFFERLGWSKGEYDAVFSSEAYQRSRADIQTQALALMVAHRLLLEHAGSDPATSQPDVDRRAAEWVLRSGSAPFAIPPALMLYVATLDPREVRSTTWRCRASSLLERNVDTVVQLQRKDVSGPEGMNSAFLDRWRKIATDVRQGRVCPDATQPRSPRASAPRA